MRSRWMCNLAATVVTIYIFATGAARSADLWMGAVEPVWRTVRGWPANDYLTLFQPNAPWQQASANVRVFQVSKRFVLQSSDDELRLVIEGLRQRHIKLAMQGTPLTASSTCGIGIEGHGPANDMVQLASRLRALGGELAYIRMDEPLWFGHRFKPTARLKACQNDIAELARQTAVKIRAVREIFPRVIVGDIEPIGLPQSDEVGWLSDLHQWFDAYRSAMGEPLGFFHADVVWKRPTWIAALPDVAALVRSQGMPLGIVYNGVPTDSTDAEWTSDAVAHFRLVEGQMGIVPDQVAIQSWMDWPRSMLPEDQNGTLTNLVLQYEAWSASRH